MSLINDALRRAKQAQQEAEPPPAPGLRPVEQPAPPTSRSTGLLLPIIVGAAALVAVLLLSQLFRHGGSTNAGDGSGQLSVAARPLTSVDAPRSTASDNSTQTAPASSLRSQSEAPAAVAAEPANHGPGSTALGSGTNVVERASEVAETNRPSSIEPPPLKLQSIVFNPKRPSAMINGRVLFVGDKIQDLRIMAIRRTEVVLTGVGRTNVLSLEP